MNSLVDIVLPVFGFMGIGYLAAWIRLVPERAAEGLTSYIFSLAIPLLVFRTIGGGIFPDASPWAYWAAYFAGVATTWAAAGLTAYLVLGESPLRAVMTGCAASYSNTMLLGLPLVLFVFGEAGGVPLFLLLSVHLPIMLVASIGLCEAAGRTGATNWRALARDVARSIVTNPIMIGIFAGLAWRYLGFTLPGVGQKIINSIADTAIPCALVAMGLTLRRYGIRGNLKLTALIIAGKLVLHPLIVLAAARAFELPPVWTGVAVLFAAAPTGINTYVIANRYEAAVGPVSSALLLGSGLSLFTIAMVLAIVGVP